MTLVKGWEVVVGLEVHVQLLTASKLFSPAPTKGSVSVEPNVNVDVVDAGLPGVLPVLNARAVELAVRVGLALGGKIAGRSVFARKHYFYPDLPKGYQISQLDDPIVQGGALVVDGRSIGITRAHLEEDAGKSQHVDSSTFLDFNRAGTPLLEVVSEPDLRSGQEAEAFFRTLRSLVIALEVCDGNLQEGSMRADANVSVRRPGAPLGQRVELKNINSPRFLAAAIEHEARRQMDEIASGRPIFPETRQWDADRKESRSMRGKEDAHDYRYLPDPDLPAILLTEGDIERLRAAMPELPDARHKRYQGLGLAAADAAILSADAGLARFFEEAIAVVDKPKAVANWVINEVLRIVNERGLEVTDPAAVISAPSLAQLVQLVDEGKISGKSAKEVFAVIAIDGSDPVSVIEARGLWLIKDLAATERAVEEAIADSPQEWQSFLAGKTKMIGYFVGQVMKKTGGAADPKDVNGVIEQRRLRG